MRLRIRELFVHSKSEIRLSLVIGGLLILMVIFRTVHFSDPVNTESDHFEDSLLMAELMNFANGLTTVSEVKIAPVGSGFEKIADGSGGRIEITPVTFNPNTAKSEDLLAMGLDKFVVQNWMNYLKSGGKFRKKEDIQKVYGLTTETAKLLIPYILVETEAETREDNAYFSEERPQVELNTCSAEQLAGLPFIGMTLSGRIIKYRSMLGGFISADQLNEVYGLNDSILEKIKPLLRIDTSKIDHIDLQKISYKDLLQHPYLKAEHVEALLNYRSFAGENARIEEIKSMQVLPNEILSKISPYFR